MNLRKSLLVITHLSRKIVKLCYTGGQIVTYVQEPFSDALAEETQAHIKITEDDLERFRQYLVNLTPEEVKNLGKVSKREQKKREIILAEVRELSNIPREVLNRPCTGFGSALYSIRSAMCR